MLLPTSKWIGGSQTAISSWQFWIQMWNRKKFFLWRRLIFDHFWKGKRKSHIYVLYFLNHAISNPLTALTPFNFRTTIKYCIEAFIFLIAQPFLFANRKVCACKYSNGLSRSKIESCTAFNAFITWSQTSFAEWPIQIYCLGFRYSITGFMVQISPSTTCYFPPCLPM